MEYSNYTTLSFSRADGILTVSLDRPEVLNAANAEMEIDLARFFVEVIDDEQTRVVVLTGAGKTFSAGGDFDYMRALLENPALLRKAIPHAKRMIFTLLDCPKPVIAKINGHAIGFGATLALFCDVTFAAEHARIADPHVAVGLVAGDGGAIIWPQLIGYNRAKEYLFTGEFLLAPEAARIGLINHSVPADELDDRVNQYALKVAAMPVHAVRWTKTTVNIGLKQIAHSMMDASFAYEVLSSGTADHREAVAALTEKRKPRFKDE
ncbi:enoyl-CoA hydratase/isomerase family protein [Pseudomonas brassicacearum]|uniref:Enoyl-CoA hydratase n=1 Tax=Pseudomonas brassicacearum TaxID=930166 RepID=A0A423JJP4_9PSED|nr:enoyl-CoA hydratase-related protein [Pseudomonas brassicacearum]RON37914.1 enoyl-CoA hydratase [Pseudomonas brassicacearum]